MSYQEKRNTSATYQSEFFQEIIYNFFTWLRNKGVPLSNLCVAIIGSIIHLPTAQALSILFVN